MAAQGHYAGRTFPSNTQQGTYMAAPDGTFLASVNTRDPKVMAEKLREALSKWRELEATKRSAIPVFEGAAPRARFEQYYPSEGLVLHMTVRDLPRTDLPKDWRASAWNQDFAWFTKEEARQMLPEKIEEGQAHEAPSVIATRLARFHLVDTVRGQSLHYPANAVREASLRVEVVKVESGIATIALQGKTQTVHGGRWAVDGYRDLNQPSDQVRGVETQLLGRAKYDMIKERFLDFELVALGTRYGATAYNGRGDDKAPAAIGFLFRLAGDSPQERVAPAAFWDYGWRR